MKHFGGVDPAVFIQGGLVRMTLSAMREVEPCAIVGAPRGISKIIATMNPVIADPVFADICMRTFPSDGEAEARAWLGAKPAP